MINVLKIQYGLLPAARRARHPRWRCHEHVLQAPPSGHMEHEALLPSGQKLQGAGSSH